MRSLRSRLILAFILVSLVIIAIVVTFARWNTSAEFRRYVFDRNQENIVSVLENYYSLEGSWSGVQQIFPRGPMPFGMMQHQVPVGDIVLIDAGNNVVIGGRGYPRGGHLAPHEIEGALPIEVEDELVGYIVLRQDAFREQPVESAFLQRLSQSLLIGSLAVIALALLLGYILARSLTHPLAQLTAATRRVASGDLGVKVDVGSQDELGELARSFNMMNDRLAQARDARRQMTADIAHELRTPVSVILGYADGLKEDVIPPSQETFALIQEQAEQLELLIDDLRILSQADAGELALELSLVDPLVLLERTIAAHEPQASRQKITLHLETTGEVPPILIDPDRFRQVLSNLLTNALQYTPAGGQVTAVVTANQNGVSFAISDTGPGIAPEDLEHIFQRFYRSDRSRSRETGGSGLGLSIARSLVERQGGRVSVESEPGDGATFTIEFPLPPG